MNPRSLLPAPGLILLRPTVFLFALGGWFSVAPAAEATAATAARNTAQGLHTATFTTTEGKISVYLPDDMAAGDTITGTVVAAPAGENDADRVRNRAVLEGRVIDLGGATSVPVAKGAFSFQLPATQAAPIVSVTLSGSGPRARPLATTLLPVNSSAATSGAASNVTPVPWAHDWPAVVSLRDPVPVHGPFDGNAANTNVTVGASPVPVLAESPRQAVFVMPSGLLGPAVLTVAEGAQSTRGDIRCVQVQLQAPKTELTAGETTEVAITVRGLEGCAFPVPMQLRATGSVTASGGNAQNLTIPPATARNGVFETARTLTGTAPGDFGFSAEIVYAQPAPAVAAGDVVHVENVPHGGRGLWRVPIKLQDGTESAIWIEAEKKPDLKYCNWIKLGACDQRGHETYVSDYEKTKDPTKKPPTKATPPPVTPPLPPVPPAGGAGKPEDIPPPPCKEGATRILSSEVKEFTILDPDGVPIFQCYTDKNAATAAGNGLSEFFKDGAKIGDLMKKALPGGVGKTVAGWLVGYLKGGSAILDEVLAGTLKDASVGKVTVAVDLPVKKITATCTTYEICRNGVLVIEKKFTESVERTRLKDHKVADSANQSNGEWEKIADSSSRYDAAKAEAWAKKFLDDHLAALEQAEKDYADFKDKCK